ncbi:MAG: hypothetical protein IJU52_01595 [Clostridia bacterium]|nr:hypothetical protein [Clostridia bacterium]
MEDEAIVELFFARNEEAVTQSRKKYGRRCRAIAQRFLNSREDAEEIESDVLLKAWKTIPPNRPKDLGYYLALITRQLSINR